MTEDERNRLILKLGEDLEDSLLNDRGFRADFCVEHFRSMSDEELRQCYADAGLDQFDAEDDDG